MNKLPKVIKINDPESRKAVAKLAIEDNDNMQMSTHAIVKGDEIVGGWNLCEAPVFMMWHHSQKVGAKDTLLLQQIQESMLSEKGINQYFVACNSHSPYYNHVERLGYKPVWPTNIFYKELPKL